MRIRTLFAFLAMLAVGTTAFADDYKLGDLIIKRPYARATVPNQPSGGVFFSIENTGKQGDKLIGVATTAAKRAELHTMAMEGNVMKMREVDAIEVAPSAKVEMMPGKGYHVMLMGLNRQLKRNDKFPLTLTFEKAGKLDISVQVDDMGAAGGMHGSMHGH